MAKVILICGKNHSEKTEYTSNLVEKNAAIIYSIDEIFEVFNLKIYENQDVFKKAKEYVYNKSVEIVGLGVNVILDWGFELEHERLDAMMFFKSNKIKYEWHYLDMIKSDINFKNSKEIFEVSEKEKIEILVKPVIDLVEVYPSKLNYKWYEKNINWINLKMKNADGINVKDLYSNEQYKQILHYFIINKITNILYINELNFQELFCNPEIPIELVKQAKKLYIKALNFIQKYETEPVTIADVYSNISRGDLFIEWCDKQDKKYIHQINEKDFIAVRAIKGLGITSIENFKKIFNSLNSSEYFQKDERNQTEFYADTPIEDIFGMLPHGGALCKHCHSVELWVLADLETFSFDYKEVKGIGKKSMKQLEQVYINSIIKSDVPSFIEASDFAHIPHINEGIEIPFESILSEGINCIGDICKNGISTHLYLQIRTWLDSYKKSIDQIFMEEILKLKENSYYCLISRSDGHTLQQIADKLGMTRERVRQIIVKEICVLQPIVADLINVLLYKNKTCFTYNNVENLLNEYAGIFRFILKQKELCNFKVVYLEFANKFIKNDTEKIEYEVCLRQLVSDVIGDNINFFDNLEFLDIQMKKMGIVDLDFEDLMNYLIKDGYRFYGDYVMRGHQSYAIVCVDAVRKFFPNGIKLNNDKNNEDLSKLRCIIDRYYNGLELPDNNRALSVRMIPLLILSGKGQYIAIEYVIYEMNLFDDIYKFIHNSPQSSFYYSELFDQFKSRLLAESNINNYNFLHGMLKYIYPEDFDYSDRDVFTKIGGIKKNADTRIKELLITQKRPLTKKEIKEAIPGINDFVMAFAANREERVMPWGYNSFNHIDNLIITEKDMECIEDALNSLLKEYKGYINDGLLFQCVKEKNPSFLEQNGMDISLNLYNTTSVLFKGKYRFRRPHILAWDVPIEEISMVNIIKYLLNCTEKLSYKEYIKLVSIYGWADGTTYAIFRDLEKEYIRISNDEYVLKTNFIFESSFLDNLSCELKLLVLERDYLILHEIFYLEALECKYEWNGFLLESIISEFDIGYKIISPQIKDRRYQQKIILEVNHLASSFEDLIMLLMKKDGVNFLNRAEFHQYLKQKGLINKVIPQEFYNSSKILFKNELFSIK